jgi:hypothetical protein
MEDGDPRSSILHPRFSAANGVVPRVPYRVDKVNHVKPAYDNSHGVAELLLLRSKIDTPFYLLLTCIELTRKKIHLNLHNLRRCVVRASGGMSIALDESQ